MTSSTKQNEPPNMKMSGIGSLVRANWKAGLTVALISVPLSIALSIASGAGPIAGIITGIWATAIAGFFGSSNYNIIGAAGALTTVLFGATLVAPLGLGAAALPLLAVATGIILLVVWFAGLDRFLYYIPSSVMYGFATGVAFLIAASQLFDATGLSMLKRTGHFLGDIELFFEHAADVHGTSIIVFIVFLAAILVWKRYVKKLPAVIPIAVLGIVFGALDAAFFDLGIMSLGEKFGSIAGAIASPIALSTWTAIMTSPSAIIWIFRASLIIALIAVLETLITAKIGDKITRTQSSPSRELLGLSLANIGAGFMGGLPATGVFIRTGANIKAGATHRMSAILTAFFTAVIAVVVLPFFAYVPVAVIAAILVNTAIGLIEVDKFKEFWRYEKESFIIGILVAGITILEDAGIAVAIGAAVSLLIFANKISHGRFDVIFSFKDGKREEKRGARVLHVPEGSVDVVTYSIAGFLGYIDSERHAANLRRLAQADSVRAVVIRLRDLYSIDYEGQEMLRDAIVELANHGKRVHISSARPDIAEELGNIPDITKNVVSTAFTMKTQDVLVGLGVPLPAKV